MNDKDCAMSKRAEEKAMDAWAIYEYREHPKGLYHTCFVDGYKEGYEQAEKDTIERVCEWLKIHAEDYIINLTSSYPDAPFEAAIGGKCWVELKKAMEKEEAQEKIPRHKQTLGCRGLLSCSDNKDTNNSPKIKGWVAREPEWHDEEDEQ